MITTRGLRKFLGCSQEELRQLLYKTGLPVNPHYAFTPEQARMILAQRYEKAGRRVLERAPELGLESPHRPEPSAPPPDKNCPR